MPKGDNLVDDLRRDYAGLTCASGYDLFKVELYMRAADDMTCIDSIPKDLRDIILNVVPEHISGCSECNARYVLDTALDEYFDLVTGRGFKPIM